jgi:hypothetical protein
MLNRKADMASSILEGGKMKRTSQDFSKLALDKMMKHKIKKRVANS